MIENHSIAKFCKLLLVIPTLLLLFACTGVDEVSSATDGEVDSVELAKQHQECFQSVIIGEIYDTTSHITMGMYSHMTQGTMALMMVAFAIWLAWKMLVHVSSFTEESPAEVWTEIAQKLFICLVCGLLASSSAGVIWVLNSIIFPIYNAFLELGSAMLGHMSQFGAGEAGDEYATLTIFGDPKIGTFESNYNAVCSPGNLDPATPESFPTTPKRMMQCMACAVNQRLNFGFSLSWTILRQPGFMGLICGLIMMSLFIYVKLGFVVYLVDSIFRFAMMVLILPILIMAYAFKPTREWTKIGFLTILNSGAFMMCIAIVILIGMAGIQKILVYNRVLWEEDASSLADFSKPLLMFLLAGFLLVGSIKIAQSIADKLIGGGGATNFQSRLGALGGTATTWLLLGAKGKMVQLAKNAIANRHSRKEMKAQQKKDASLNKS